MRIKHPNCQTVLLILPQLQNPAFWGNVKAFRVPNPNDPATDLWYASLEGPEAAMYVRGKGQLVNGQATLELPGHFRSMMVPESLTVQLTPGSRHSKGLAYEVQNGQIVVFELSNGRGNYEFSWGAPPSVKAVRTTG